MRGVSLSVMKLVGPDLIREGSDRDTSIGPETATGQRVTALRQND
jgi:hypothetical protein